MNVKKIDLRSLSPPPPTFNMQTIQKELSRLARDHTEFEEKLREHKAKADAVDELFIYTQHSIQRHEVDQSALLDGSPTLTERLVALEDITRRLEQDELASRPLMEKVTNLETSVWFQQGQTNSAITRMDRLEEYHRELWRGAQDWLDGHQKEFGSIQVEHVLEQHLTESIGKLPTQVDNVEKSVMTMLSSVTAVSEST